MAENGTVAYVTELPDCDIHKIEDEQKVEALYDLKTAMGPWAFVCEAHRESHAFYKELGTGKGQKLEVRADG